LLENRYILSERVTLADTARKRAKDILDEGLISRQAYESSQLAYQAVNRELDTLSVALKRVWQDDLPPQVSIFDFNPVSLIEHGYDLEALLSRYLSQDTAYQQALLEMQKASIDSGMFSVQDAPALQMSFQLSPFYSPSDGNTFFSSFSELFSDTDPQMTFSIAFSTTDLFRKSSSLQQLLAQEALDSAKAGLDPPMQKRKISYRKWGRKSLGTLRELEFLYLQMRLQGLLE
jgi:hypothetical protein